MSEAITFPKDTGFSGLRLEHTPNGNVVSPWFSYDWRTDDCRGVAYYGAKYQAIKAASVAAFSQLLGIQPLDVVITEKNDPSEDVGFERQWRLGTRRPCALPQTKPKPKPVLPENRGAIDI